MESLIEKNAARIIITTLLALVIVGIAIGAGIQYNVDNYDPGHSILEIGDPNYYFVEDNFDNDPMKKFLVLELTGNDEYVGRLDIRPGVDDGVVIRQGGDFGFRDPALFLRAYSDHARLDFYPGVVDPTPNQLSVYVDKVVIPQGIEFCIGGTSSSNCISGIGSFGAESFDISFNDPTLSSLLEGSLIKSELTPGATYWINVYGIATNKGTGTATLGRVGVRECSGSSWLATTPLISVDWPDGNPPQSASFVITVPSTGCIRGVTGIGAAMHMSGFRLN